MGAGSRIGRQPNAVKHATMLQLQEIKMAKGLPVDFQANAAAHIKPLMPKSGDTDTSPSQQHASSLAHHSGVNDDVFPGQPPSFYHSLSSGGDHLAAHKDRRKDSGMTKRSFSVDDFHAKNHYMENKEAMYRNHGYPGVNDMSDLSYQLQKAGGGGGRSGAHSSMYYNHGSSDDHAMKRSSSHHPSLPHHPAFNDCPISPKRASLHLQPFPSRDASSALEPYSLLSAADDWRHKHFDEQLKYRHDLETLHRYASGSAAAAAAHIERPLPRFPASLPELRFMTPGLQGAMHHPIMPPPSAYLRHMYPQQLSPRLPHPAMLAGAFPPHSAAGGAAHHLASSAAASFSAHSSDSNHYHNRHRSRYANDVDALHRHSAHHQDSYHHHSQRHHGSGGEQQEALVSYSAGSTSPPSDSTPPSSKHLQDTGQAMDDNRYSSDSSSSLISVADRLDDGPPSRVEHSPQAQPASATQTSESNSPLENGSTLVQHSQQLNTTVQHTPQNNSVPTTQAQQKTSSEKQQRQPPPPAQQQQQQATATPSSTPQQSGPSKNKKPEPPSSSEPKPSLLMSELTSSKQLPSIARTIEQVQNAYRELMPILKRVSTRIMAARGRAERGGGGVPAAR